VLFFRLLDPASKRVVTVYRRNATNGVIGLKYGGSHFTTSGSLALNTWGKVSVHVVVAGMSSTVDVRLNGSLIYQGTNANLSTAVATVQLGNDASAQAFALFVDTVEVDIPDSDDEAVARWHMDETSGSTMHDAVGDHDGTIHSVQLGVPGFRGTAFGFNGNNSYVSVPSSNDLNPGSADLTLTIHMKTTTAPASPDWDLMRKGVYATAGGEWKVEYQPSGQASCGFKGSSSYSELIAGPSLKDGNWHTVQCVKTASAIKLVVDGQTFTKSGGVGTISNAEPIVIGSHAGSAEFFNGSLDEASIQIG
jgi:hypothetical protein